MIQSYETRFKNLEENVKLKEAELEIHTQKELALQETIQILQEKLDHWETNLEDTFTRKVSDNQYNFDQELDDLVRSVSSFSVDSNISRKSTVSNFDFGSRLSLARRCKSARFSKTRNSQLAPSQANDQDHFCTEQLVSHGGIGAKNNVLTQEILHKIKTFYAYKISDLNQKNSSLEDCYDHYFHSCKKIREVCCKIVKHNYTALNEDEIFCKSVKNNMNYSNNITLPNYTILLEVGFGFRGQK